MMQGRKNIKKNIKKFKVHFEDCWMKPLFLRLQTNPSSKVTEGTICFNIPCLGIFFEKVYESCI